MLSILQFAQSTAAEAAQNAAEEAFAIDLWGAGALGLVLGWVLYFSIRGKAGQISVTEFAAIVAAVVGGTVTGTITGDPKMLGAYGLGLAAGFFALLILTALFVRKDKATSSWTDALERSVREDEGPERPGDAIKNWRRGLESNSGLGRTVSGADADVAAARDALTQLIVAIGLAMRTATGDEYDYLDRTRDRLIRLRRELSLTQALSALSRPEVTALWQVTSDEAAKLNAEAQKLKDLTNAINEFNAALSAVSGAAGALKSLLD